MVPCAECNRRAALSSPACDSAALLASTSRRVALNPSRPDQIMRFLGVSGWSKPPATAEASAWPGGHGSYTVRLLTRPARCHAVDKPAKPPPTTATFKSDRSIFSVLVAGDEAKRRARRGRCVREGRPRRGRKADGRAMVVLGKRQQQQQRSN